MTIQIPVGVLKKRKQDVRGVVFDQVVRDILPEQTTFQPHVGNRRDPSM